jgi:Holliday junction resolvase RusA-like endonuclease
MITLTFPGMKPHAKDRARFHNVSGRHMVAPKFRQWRHEFVLMTRSQTGTGRREPITEPIAVAVTYRTATGNMRPDVDNAAGAVLDALQDAGIIANDSQVRRLLVEVVKAPRADVGITVRIEAIGTTEATG